ncbi:MAG: hypothetical protein ABI700_24875 [Chloroflexota bacterium]
METQAEYGTSEVVKAGESRSTTDHATIRDWIEARDGSPAWLVQRNSADDQGRLRVEFSGYRSGEWLEAIRWETFFQRFEDAKLAFVYQDSLSDGTISRFCTFVPRR